MDHGVGNASDDSPNHNMAFPGCALVVRDGHEAFRYAGGGANSSADETSTSNTRFQLASVSKQFTATAALILVGRGELSIDARLNAIVPGGPPQWDAITVHQLLCHTAGLPHWRDLPGLDLCDTHVDPDDLLARFRRAEMIHEPGTGYSYSSPGYVLIARIVERVSTMGYRDFLHREIFHPVGMPDTIAGNASGPEYAVPCEDGNPVPSFDLDVIGMGAGDVWSTVDDQLAWNRSLRDGGVLDERWSRAMQSVQTPIIDERYDPIEMNGYGYGLYIGSVTGRPLTLHTGDNAGFLALNAWLGDADSHVIMMTNDIATPFLEAIHRLIGIALAD